MPLEAPAGQEFRFKDGTAAKSLSELMEQVKKMAPEALRIFANESKNDFANWAEYALQEKTLADRLRSTANKDIMLLKMMEKLEEAKAEENLFTIAQGQRPEKKRAEAESGESSAEEKAPGWFQFPNLPYLQKKLLIKEFIIGVILGVVMGFFLTKVIASLAS